MNQENLPPHIQYLMNHGKLKFIGKPCRHNEQHVGLRYILGHDCVECGVFETWDVEAAQKFSWVSEGVVRDAFTSDFSDLVVSPPPFKDARRNRSAAGNAFRDNLPYFHGSPCLKCDCTLRFASTASCVACQRVVSASEGEGDDFVFRNRAQALEFVEGRFVPVLRLFRDRQVRQVAKSLDLDRYSGVACGCGNRIRYTSRGQCVSCVKERNDARATKKKTAPAQTGAAETFDWLFE